MKRVVDAVQAVALVLVAFTVVMLFVNDSSDPSPAGRPTSAVDGQSPSVEIDAPGIFATRCAGCHGDSGSGSIGPRLNNGRMADVFPDVNDQIAVVAGGRGSMPAFEGRLTADEIAAVVEFTRNEL